MKNCEITIEKISFPHLQEIISDFESKIQVFEKKVKIPYT